jgi:hypothetical protein
MRLDDPVVGGPQFGKGLPRARDEIMEDLAETGRNRPKLRTLDSRRKLDRPEFEVIESTPSSATCIAHGP